MTIVCTYVHNPLAPHLAEPFAVMPGTKIRDLHPDSPFPYVCNLDGMFILREQWDYELHNEKMVTFINYPQGGGGQGGSDPTRTILTLVAIYAAITVGAPELAPYLGGNLAVAQALSVIIATTLVNVLVPVEAGSGGPGLNGTQTSPSYSGSLSGNQARLDQPIPVLYGRNKSFPDFAAQPYIEYIDDDQYYKALLCLGQGNYNIEGILIDDTNINDYKDILVKRVLPPGTQPSDVRANVTNAVEVTGAEVLGERYSGPAMGCKALSTVTDIEVDITFSRGLATYDSSGNAGSKNVQWRVEFRAVNDFGGPLGVWTSLGDESLTLAQTSAVRRTYKYTMPTVCRPQFRLFRITEFDPNDRVANTMEWAGLRCFLADPAPLCSTATYIEIVMRASEQLSGLTQRKMAVISRRLVRTWSPGGGFTAEVETRNPAWALIDKWTNSVYGDGYDPSYCDLTTLYNKSLTWDQRQDRFDAIFDQTYESFQADQMIAQAGRAAVFRRNSLITLTRDEKKDLPTTGFTGRNISPSSVEIHYAFATENAPDGVIIEYFDYRVWDWVPITCPLPTVTTPVRAQRLRLFGITGPTQAKREGLYHAFNAYYRRKFPSFKTELEGMLPAFGSAVVFAPSLPGWGHGGDVVDFNVTTKEITLTEPVAWQPGKTHYLSFIDRKGSMVGAIPITPGTSNFQAVLSTLPSITLSTNRADEERTKYVVGIGTPYEAVIRIIAIRNSTDQSGARSYTVESLIENDLVHTADLSLLPSDGEIQDDVDAAANGGTGEDGGGGGVGTVLIPHLQPAGDGFNPFTDTLPDRGAGIEFHNDGTGYYYTWSDFESLQGPFRIPTWWLVGNPVETSSGAYFEIRITNLLDAAPSGDLANTWLSLSTTRKWYVTAYGGGAMTICRFKIEIRSQADGVVQAFLENVEIVASNA